jgi:manganese transport protein
LDSQVKSDLLYDRASLDATNTPNARQSRFSEALRFIGPSVVVSVAYVDPGNIATNIQAGALYGYSLIWVVLLANLIAMLFQGLSAKLGIVTGHNLAELCRSQLPKPIVWLMWSVSEVAAMATELAEVIGGGVGFALLLHVSVIAGMVLTVLFTYILLMLERRGYRRLEFAIGFLVGLVGLSYLVELLIVPVHWPDVLTGVIRPNLPDPQAITIAAGIVGATVMPHALFLHSGLTQRRHISYDKDCNRIIRHSNIEVLWSLAGAGVINVAMVIVAAGAFHHGNPEVAELQTAYQTFLPLFGGAAAGIFLVSLIASGTSSSVVATMAGQLVMQGFLGMRVRLWIRRFVTIIPAFVIVGSGVDATKALVLSQVALSATLPFPMIALVWLTSRERVMGTYRSSPLVVVLAIVATALICGLNIILLLGVAGLHVTP